jgi:pSer/pThr/pTyr-binding forkhead associated (FHA) protein
MGKKRFTVLEGPDRGLTFSLEDGQSYVIGRDQPHDAGLNDEYAAAEHCELSMSDGRVCLRDLGSSTGTSVNDSRITESVLSNGDEFSLGTTRIRIDDYVSSGHTIGLDRSALDAHLQARQSGDKPAPVTPMTPDAAETLPPVASPMRPGVIPHQLVVIKGLDQGKTFALQEGQDIVIGRGKDTTLQLTDPRTSRKHCLIEVRSDQIRVLDTGGSGGTHVNSRPVSRHNLSLGDRITIGDSEFRLETADGTGQKDSASSSADDATKPGVSGTDFFDLVGQKIHNYQVEREIARGNSGVIFKCRDTEKDRDIALKVLWPELSKDSEEVQRFVRAMKTMFPIRHENLVRIYNAGRSEQYVWVALEYVEGESLDRVIQRIGTVGMLDWEYSFRVAVQVSRGLVAAYEHNIIHRNITPENILIRSSDKTAKLGDMMLAKALESSKSEQLTKPGQLIGDIAYAPPERTDSSGEIDCRSDIYSLGATMYALITGRPPFESSSLPGLISSIRTETPVAPKEFQLSIHGMFEGAVLRMLEKRPEDRFETPIELLKDLERIGKFAGINV